MDDKVVFFDETVDGIRYRGVYDKHRKEHEIGAIMAEVFKVSEKIAGLNNQLANIQARQNALRDMERALNDSLRDRNQLRDREIAALNETLRIERERAREAKDALDEELRRFRELIEARRRALREQQDARRFEQNLSDRQLDVQRIESRLAELANNDSLAARRERAELEQQLAQAQRALDNLIFDEDIKRQDQALQDELARFQAKIQNEKDGIDAALLHFERSHQARIDLIGREREAHEATIQAQIDGLRRQGEEYDRQADNVRRQIQDIQDRMSRNGYMVRKAMAEIDRDAEDVYRRLLAWNAKYGSGIDADISSAWRRFNDLVQQTNETTLDRTQRQMMNILETIRSMEMAQHSLNSAMAQMGIQGGGVRAHFEGLGHDVGWHREDQQFSINGHRFDIAPFDNIDGRLFATPAQMLQLERDLEELTQRLSNMNSFDKGGRITHDQIALVHKDEEVLTPPEAKLWRSGELSKINITTVPMGQFGEALDNITANSRSGSDWLSQAMGGVSTQNINHAPTIHIEAPIHASGLTSEKFLEQLPDTMKAVVDRGLGEYKRQEGLATSVPSRKKAKLSTGSFCRNTASIAPSLPSGKRRRNFLVLRQKSSRGQLHFFTGWNTRANGLTRFKPR